MRANYKYTLMTAVFHHNQWYNLQGLSLTTSIQHWFSERLLEALSQILLRTDVVFPNLSEQNYTAYTKRVH